MLHLDPYAIISSFVLVYGKASFKVGKHSYVGSQSLINVEEDVYIGDVTGIGFRCMIFTHLAFLPFNEGYWVNFSGVTIGSYVGIASGVFIHPGVIIEDNTFINSRSVVKTLVRSGEVIEGNPAKPIGTMIQLKRNMSAKRLDKSFLAIMTHFMKIISTYGYKYNSNIDKKTNCSCIFFKKNKYLIHYLPSNTFDYIRDYFNSSKRIIFINNHSNWVPPKEFKDYLIIDLLDLRIEQTKDPIYNLLVQFLNRYYGFKFSFKN